MAPIRLTYNATPLRLAASLGSPVARDSLPPDERRTLDDAFAVLMSCSDLLSNDERFKFGPPRFWPYTLEAALRMAVAAYRTYIPDWEIAIDEHSATIPANIPRNFPFRIIGTLTKWILDPTSFSWEEHAELYDFIKDDVCLDGYLTNEFPNTPVIVRSICYGSLYLIDIENCQPDAAPVLHEFNPAGIYSARASDAIAQLLYDGFDESRIRRAIRKEVVPWCLGQPDPLESGK